MLRLTVCFLITGFLFVVNFIVGPRAAQSVVTLRQLTDTPEHAVNLNPSLSDDGKIVVFESSADLAGTGSNTSFHALQANLSKPDVMFDQIARSRIVSPSLSSDGKTLAFASTEDLVARNSDRNAEIFLFDGSKVQQITETQATALEARLTDGNFQPSLTANGTTIAFSSNRNLTGANADLSFEIFLFDAREQKFTQMTSSTAEHVAASPKISADGTRIYYKLTALTTPNRADLMLIETRTGLSHVLAADVPELTLAEGRSVSSDGMRLVYSGQTAPNQSQVFMFEGRDDSIRQLTQLSSRVIDVRLQPTISGDGRRIAFATRRRVSNATDGSVELYVLDLPTGKIEQITNAPAAATAEVVASLSFDGSLVAFNFPRVLSGTVSDEDLRNNSEIFLASVPPRAIGVANVSNAAAKGNEAEPMLIAPGSIASLHGNALALKTEASAELPLMLAGTTVTVNGHSARLFYVAPDEVNFVVPDELKDGPAEFLVTNADGLSSRAEAIIARSAPGVFTIAGDGRGEAIILDSNTMTSAPFDPSSGELRLSIFATGISRAKTVAVTINGRTSAVERVMAAGLPGLDEIHVLAPAELRGAGSCTLLVNADGLLSNPVSVLLSGVAPTPTPTPTPSVTPTPTPTPNPTPLPSPSPSPSPTSSPSPTPTPSVSPTPTPSPSPTPSPGASPGLVISQVFGGGGNSGAPFRNDFIEIFNRSTAAVNLSGWSVQYASATASTWSVTPLTAVTLLPGQYYLIQESSGGSNGISLPAADANGSITMAAGSGKVALVKNSAALTGSCPNDSNIVDLVGYGSTANCFKGSAPAPAASNTNAILRAVNGCTDTRNNLADFALGPPNPRNTSFLPRICTD